MKKTLTKILSVMLIVCITLTSAPLSGLVGLELPDWLDFSIVSKAATVTGSCGDNLIWTYDTTTRTLTISGTGAMYDYEYNTQPWKSYKSSIKEINVKSGVTTIGDWAFCYCDSLTNITLPNSVTSIGKRVFQYCESLICITLPNSITTIDVGLFYECTSLTNITIPDNVTIIGDLAFAYCESLTSVTIPDGVTSIGVRALSDCTKLTSITVESNNEYYSSDEYGVLFNKDRTTLIQYPAGNTRTNYTIPDSITLIGIYAFRSCERLTSVTIPDSVITIGNVAFWCCTRLTSITIPDSVTIIGDFAFTGCDSLTSITVPDSVTSIGDYAFHSCNRLTDVYYVGTEVQWNAISIDSYNEPLMDATIHYNIKSGNCGDNLTWIFEESTGLLTIFGTGEMYDYEWNNRPWESYRNKIIDIIISNDITTIGDWVFHHFENLERVTISNSVTKIGAYAFDTCYKLENITIPDSVTIIGEKAFNWCYNFTDITIPKSVTTIGDKVFQNCHNLENIIVDKENQCFSSDECGVLFNKEKTSLIRYPVGNLRKSYKIPNSVTDICNSAFSGWENNLEIIALSENMIAIGNGAFSGCQSLIDIIISNNIKVIEDNAFLFCDALTNIYYSGVEIQWNAIPIGSGNAPLLNATIHYNCCLYNEDYQHSYKTDVIQPTCTTQGYTTYTCLACGDTYTSDYIDAKGHTDGEIVEENYISPTCTATGSKDNVTYCTVCIEETSRETITIPALGHDIIIDEAIAPDCTNTGLTAGEHCTRCDYKIEQTVVDALGHKYESVVTAPTCTSQGYTTYTCHCGDTYTSDYVDASGHNYKDGICVDCDTPDPAYFTFEIQKPSTTTIRCKDGIKLYAKTTGKLPDGARIEWSADNGNFDVNASASGNEITIISKNNGYTTFTATVYDADNNVIAQDTIEMYSKAGLFDKIGGFFRSLFGSTRIYEN